MASFVAAVIFLFATLHLHQVLAADPDITTDFVVPLGINASTLHGSFFTSTLIRNVTIGQEISATVNPVNSKAFPAMVVLGSSSAMLTYPPQIVNALHIHPRGPELLYVIDGELSVGVSDSTNMLFTQPLYQGDLFVFLKGLVHFLISWDTNQTSVAVAGFLSSNPRSSDCQPTFSTQEYVMRC